MNLGQYIKNTLKEQGRKINWLADQLNTNEKTFGNKLRRNKLNAEELIKITKILNLDFEKLKNQV
jgi:hypothetical protein